MHFDRILCLTRLSSRAVWRNHHLWAIRLSSEAMALAHARGGLGCDTISVENAGSQAVWASARGEFQGASTSLVQRYHNDLDRSSRRLGLGNRERGGSLFAPWYGPNPFAMVVVVPPLDPFLARSIKARCGDSHSLKTLPTTALEKSLRKSEPSSKTLNSHWLRGARARLLQVRTVNTAAR